MDPLLLLGGGALALYALSNSSQAANVDDEASNAAATPGHFLPFGGSRALTGSQLVHDSVVDPGINLSGVTSYANYKYVQNALDALGYDINSIDISAINACVYRVSVYNWYYAFQSICTGDETKVLTDAGAYTVIDEWVKTFGYVKVAGVGTLVETTERNRFAKYDTMRQQDYYIMGDGDIVPVNEDGSTDWAEIIDDVAAAIKWLDENEWFGLGADKHIGDGLATYLIQQGMGGSTPVVIGELINNGRKYWDAAVTMHIYLVNNPYFLSIYTPVYLY